MSLTKGVARPGTVGAAVGFLLGLLVLGPSLAPGYTLHYDLVFVPDLPLSARTLGTDGSVPRAVPNDLVVALLGLLLPGWLVQKLVLLGAFVIGGAGVGRLARSLPGAAAAAALWSWNPWVGERLGIGHWGYLVGAALLPWVLQGAARSDERRGRALLVASLTAAALGGSTPGVLAALVAGVTVVVAPRPAARRIRDVALVGGMALLANAAWWWPFLRAASRSADAGGAAAFASGADTPFGVVGSLVLGGGLWNDRTWFVERTTWPLATAALLAVALVLVLALRRRAWWQDPLTRGATVAGCLGLLVAGLAALPGGRGLVETIVVHVPGGGLLRDGQKFVVLWVLLLAVATAVVVDRAVERGLPRLPLVLAALWPVATLPSLAWGHAGAWGSVDYPPEVRTVSDRLAASEEAVAVFPWSTYRRHEWNDDRVVLDPWNRLLPQRVVSDDRLALRERTVAGEDPAAERVTRSLADDGDTVEVLRSLGVRWVVVQLDQPAPPGTVPDLSGTPSRTDGDLAVHDLGPVTTSQAPPDPLRALGLLGTGLAVVGSSVLALRVRRG
ncbi:hypothetical protein ACTHQ1_15900 [Janibacter anophelis]|uniref:hypothetical protein n=1 Tax=Janibacter anophelis TaxID=319054 RepID=UPI003F7CF51A